MTRTLIAVLIILGVAGFAFSWLTHGFTVLTSEAARREAVAATPIEIPALWGIDQAGRRRVLFDEADHRAVIVDFIFTRCNSICSALGNNYQQLQADILEEHLEHAVRLVTVSFDPERDTPAVIAEYARYLRANPKIWTVLTPRDSAALRRSLTVFGVVRVPAPGGQFIHNAAFHVLDRHGRLARIVDVGQPRRALAVARLLSQLS
jgi:protein SCO1